MSDLERLLDLQANDTAADQLRHRRKVLPERETLVELDRKTEEEVPSDLRSAVELLLVNALEGGK